MAHDTKSGSGFLHVLGLVAAGFLVAICAWVWQASAQATDQVGWPEFRILAAVAGCVLVLSLAQILTSRGR
ncbi:MAG: hypothetical protein NW217_06015 [Hyphomicrobiaceae bacterium]|nr:hypothetical protein [Hyphomicrobiaceae bacterium]